jgi:hypothetical protein
MEAGMVLTRGYKMRNLLKKPTLIDAIANP